MAEDGEHGLEVLDDLDPDVIITDINMPRLDGFGFIDAVRLRDDTRTVPILVLTTESSGGSEIARPHRRCHWLDRQALCARQTGARTCAWWPGRRRDVSDPMQEIMASFFVECEELHESLVDALQSMADGDADVETINVAFRAVHSIKGGAGAFGLDALVDFSHQFETVMDACRSGTLGIDDQAERVVPALQ